MVLYLVLSRFIAGTAAAIKNCMKKQIITIVSLVILSTQAFAQIPCTAKNVAGKWEGTSVTDNGEMADCGKQTFKRTVFLLLFGNGKGNGYEASVLINEKKDICGGDEETKVQLKAELSGNSQMAFMDSDGKSFEQECAMSADGNTMFLNGDALKRQK